jgi:hypothetical protein
MKKQELVDVWELLVCLLLVCLAYAAAWVLLSGVRQPFWVVSPTVDQAMGAMLYLVGLFVHTLVIGVLVEFRKRDKMKSLNSEVIWGKDYSKGGKS